MCFLDFMNNGLEPRTQDPPSFILLFPNIPNLVERATPEQVRSLFNISDSGPPFSFPWCSSPEGRRENDNWRRAVLGPRGSGVL